MMPTQKNEKDNKTIKDLSLKDKTAVERFAIINEDKNITKFYKELRDVLWNPEEPNFEQDKLDYENVNTNPRYKELYRTFLQFFAVGDGAITEQALSFLNTATSQEERSFLCLQLLNEQDHMITYTRAINEVIPEEERDGIFSAVENLECVKAKTDFITKWCENKSISRSLRYLAGAFTEGIFFIALFSIIFYLRRKNIFTGFINANALILRDETIHRNFNIYMAKKLRDYDVSAVFDIAKEAYNVEKAHIEFIFSKPIDTLQIDELAGITKERVIMYIETIVDQILCLSGLPTIFYVKVTSFPWMEDLNLIIKKNFYEAKVTEYTSGLLIKEDTDAVQDEDVYF